MIKYDKYKPSGVEWIGDIPEHWGKCRLKNISISVNGYSFKSDDFDREYDIPVIRIGDVGDIIDFEDCIKVKSKFLEEKKDFIVKKNDILIGLTGGTIGKSGRYNYETPSLLNQRVGLLRNKKEVLNGLLYHYVKSEVFIRYIFYDCYGGGQDNISMNDIMNMVFPLPPSQEQHQIVQFLDSKTELIDKLISTKERKITLLKEQRTSLINQVVTKGLNPNVKMKKSGIEWIGEIPEHWTVLKLKHLVNKERKITYGIVQPGVYDETGRYMIRGQDYSFGWVELSKIFRVSEQIEVPYKRSRLKEGDIVFTIVGVGLGNVGIVPKELDGSNITQTTGRISIDSKYNSKFIYYFLNSDYKDIQIGFYRRGSVIPGMNLRDLESFIIFVPNELSEQNDIVEYLDSKTKEIDDLVQLEQKKIDLLKEYRQSLISEVVTGKIKVTTDE
jgi:type I restriction enzyme S subunit